MRKQLPLLRSEELLMPCTYSMATTVRLILYPSPYGRVHLCNVSVPIEPCIWLLLGQATTGRGQYHSREAEHWSNGISARYSRYTIEERDGMARRGRLTKGNCSASSSFACYQVIRNNPKFVQSWVSCLSPALARKEWRGFAPLQQVQSTTQERTQKKHSLRKFQLRAA